MKRKHDLKITTISTWLWVWQLSYCWDKFIFDFRVTFFSKFWQYIFKFGQYSKSWKLHQFHPDGDSWDIIGNILDHLLNLSPTLYLDTWHKVKHNFWKPNSESKNMVTEVFAHFCACVRRVCNWTIHLSCQLCYLPCISYITYSSLYVYPTLHITPARGKPTNVNKHKIYLSCWFLLLYM